MKRQIAECEKMLPNHIFNKHLVPRAYKEHSNSIIKDKLIFAQTEDIFPRKISTEIILDPIGPWGHVNQNLQ